MLSGISINGGVSGSNNYTLDGGLNENDQYGDININPTVDSIEEFKVQTGTMQAEFGRTGGGVINIVTKSGTNQFHGTLYEFIRNDAIQARNTFAAVKEPLVCTTSMEEPSEARSRGIKRSSSLTMKAITTCNTVIRSAQFQPSLSDQAISNLRGSSGALIPIYNPLSTVPNPNGSGYIRQPFSGNIIPPSMLDQVAKNILNDFYPLPNRTPTNSFTQSNNYNNPSAVQPRLSYQYLIKVDHRFSDNDSLIARYDEFDNLKYNLGLLTGQGSVPTDVLARHDQARDHNGLIRETHAFSPRTINELIASVARQAYVCPGFGSNQPINGPDAVPGGWAAKLGLPGDPVGLVPAITLTDGITGISNSSCSNYTLNYSFADAVTYIRGNHTFKFGADYQHLRSDFFLAAAPGNFQYNFTNGLTGNPQVPSGTGFGFASFLLGSVANATASNSIGAGRQAYSYSFFAQDDWRVNRQLTLNLGLRYDYQQWPQERDNGVSNFNPFAVDPNTGLLGRMEYGGVNFQGTPYSPDRTDFGPRIGFAYDVAGTHKTVIRGGYGIYYPFIFYNDNFPSPTGFTNTTTTYAPAGGNTNFPAFQLQGGVPTPLIPNLGTALGPSGLLGQAVSFEESDKKVPMSQQWNLTVQRVLPGGWMIEVGYLGNHGTHFVAAAAACPVCGTSGYNYNQLNPSYDSLGLALQQLVPNPYAGMVPGALGAATITRQQSLLPYPYYQSIIVTNPPIGNFNNIISRRNCACRNVHAARPCNSACLYQGKINR